MKPRPNWRDVSSRWTSRICARDFAYTRDDVAKFQAERAKSEALRQQVGEAENTWPPSNT